MSLWLAGGVVVRVVAMDYHLGILIYGLVMGEVAAVVVVYAS